MNCLECSAELIKGEPRKERDGREYTEFRCPKCRWKYMGIKIPHPAFGLQGNVNGGFEPK